MKFRWNDDLHDAISRQSRSLSLHIICALQHHWSGDIPPDVQKWLLETMPGTIWHEMLDLVVSIERELSEHVEVGDVHPREKQPD
ncbi:MAG TPA: hypothetical protein VJV04_02190 [Nitrospiraceae bacterium]|nr:hypothetical protein [Nitrospiraceae bacterium]